MSALGNKEVMANNIQRYMNKWGIDRRKLSTDLEISYTTLTDWLKAKTYPRIDKIELLANYFSVTKADLVEEYQPSTVLTLINETTAKLEETRQQNVLTYAQEQLQAQQLHKQDESIDNVIPFPKKYDFDWRGFVSAGTGEYLDGEMKETIELTEDEIPDRADFALTVNGDSMKPLFKDHETIFVEETTEILNGAIGVILIDDEAFVKKIYTSFDGMTLVSLNPEYEDIEIKNNERVKIIGRVVM
ncbi:hypothetical protein IGI37_000057 [Enterococcus sp. AZ194]|uniref:S24 family peptidase n=1 Tax=Enterococcus sp. AZ194 TaxID=2774629 RepID=UPI003F22CBB6